MSAKSNAESLDDEAADWAARLDGPDLSQAERARLKAWLASSSRHQGALIRARAAMALLDNMQDSDAPRRVGDRGVRSMMSRRVLIGGGALAAAVAGGVLMVGRQGGLETFQTAEGEIRKLTFPGGAELVLDARSRVRTAMQRGVQLVSLEVGRAAFDLRRASNAPLMVEAGDLRLQASRASFSAAREAETVDLLVAEGSVQAWRHDSGPADKLLLEQGTQATLIRASLVEHSVLTSEAVERAEAWKIGRLALDGETVAQAAAIFNRHNRQQIVISSAELQKQPLVGYFHLNDPVGFAAALETSFDAEVRQRGGTILIQ